jgi:hypothetical protein
MQAACLRPCWPGGPRGKPQGLMAAQDSVRVRMANMLRYYTESSAHAGNVARGAPLSLTCGKW